MTKHAFVVSQSVRQGPASETETQPDLRRRTLGPTRNLSAEPTDRIAPSPPPAAVLALRLKKVGLSHQPSDVTVDRDAEGAGRLSRSVTATVNLSAMTCQTPSHLAQEVRADIVALVTLRGTPVRLDDETGRALVTDCARHTEGPRTDQEPQETGGLNEKRWVLLAEKTGLLNAVNADELRLRKGEVPQ